MESRDIDHELVISSLGGDDMASLRDFPLYEKPGSRLIRHANSFGSGSDTSPNSQPTLYDYTKPYRQGSFPIFSDSSTFSGADNQPYNFTNGAKSKLLILNEKLIGFERQMERQAKQRRRLEESRFHNISSAIEKLQERLANETHSRMGTIKGLHGVFDTEIKNVEKKLEETFVDRLGKLESIIAALEERIQLIQEQVSENERTFNQHVETSCVALEKNIALVQKQFESEKLNRQEREDEISRRISQVEQKYDSELPPYIDKMDQLYGQMKKEMQDLRETRRLEELKMRESLMDEINKIHNVLIAECEAREGADEDMVKALNHYGKILSAYLGIQVDEQSVES
ncbi:SF-assemblin-beta-giardin [Babesia duncani]|uniref:SF-assemblin-beta-giardin n=1 Tax=Babesia duncani TaxID=323732 RepID=A0AAD9PGF4_9APIC|nr:SF-assemblin-beta-giardin [Babesia duncani]KAK2194928.1 SF-assemblin-beta-giardin [Babesia duncani]KAK2198176.1 SF-assemblin-beta-giardin [Babesia duncani]